MHVVEALDERQRSGSGMEPGFVGEGRGVEDSLTKTDTQTVIGMVSERGGAFSSNSRRQG